ncbi:MAG: YfjI family protein [Pseudomonadota bacterium]|nr:YfjI family protein [Pseudomonadota bacterium]
MKARIIELDGSTRLIDLPHEPGSKKTSEGNQEASTWPDPLSKLAYHGLAGDIVRIIAPHSEAASEAILIQTLTAFGNIIGRGPFYLVEGDKHPTNLFCVLVGETAKGRKGTSWGRALQVFSLIDDPWARDRIESGLSSGEGLIWAVRDPITRREKTGKGKGADYEEVEIDPGVLDKRLMVLEPEFAGVLRVLAREGNILSRVIRDAWDRGNLATMTKNSPARATGALVSIVGHITTDELRRYLDRTEAGNGFANRFIYLCVRRSKCLPEGGTLSEDDLRPLAQRMTKAIGHARSVVRIQFNEAARLQWHAVYPELSQGMPGLFGAVTSRAEAQVIRLALIYALLDLCTEIRPEHLKAAIALWEYAEGSARYIFGSALGDPLADEIYRALRAAGPLD